MAQSEARQLVAFEAYARRKELMDELQRRDWAAFAADVRRRCGRWPHTPTRWRAPTLRSLPRPILISIRSVAQDSTARLTRADYEAVAAELGCEVEAIQAVRKWKWAGIRRFAANGRPTISIRATHFLAPHQPCHSMRAIPTSRIRSWDASRYPRTQDGRWAQLREAYGLNPEEAVASASWGMFQIMGFNYAACGFANAKDFVADMAKSQARQLAAFVGVRAQQQSCRRAATRKDWAGFARRYNGAGLCREQYDTPHGGGVQSVEGDRVALKADRMSILRRSVRAGVWQAPKSCAGARACAAQAPPACAARRLRAKTLRHAPPPPPPTRRRPRRRRRAAIISTRLRVQSTRAIAPRRLRSRRRAALVASGRRWRRSRKWSSGPLGGFAADGRPSSCSSGICFRARPTRALRCEPSKRLQPHAGRLSAHARPSVGRNWRRPMRSRRRRRCKAQAMAGSRCWARITETSPAERAGLCRQTRELRDGSAGGVRGLRARQ